MWNRIVAKCRSAEEPSIEGKEIKNVAIITIAFQLVYTGFYALQNLHSSLHDEDNLGLVCLSVLYGVGIISSVLSPAIIGRFGVKPVLVMAFAAHSVYILANFYASFASMVPGAIFLGAFFGPAWTSQGVYVSACSYSYSKTSSSSPFSVLSRFNGFFFAVMASTQIVGNVFTSLVIRDGIGNDSEVLLFKYCGSKDCPAFENATEIEDVEPWVIDVTMFVFMALSICGLLLIFIALTPLHGSQWIKEITPKQMTADFLQLLITPNMALLVPFMIFTGMEHAFLMGSFTKSYISCPIGIHMVGFVMSAYGITTPVFFLIFSKLVRVTGRFLLIMASSILYLVLLLFLLHWEPKEEDALVVFVVPVMWGIAESIQQAQVNALIALLFPDQKEAAFANFHAWRSLGYCVTFLNVAYMCVSDKIIICIACLVVGSGLYVFVEIKTKVKEQDEKKATPCNGNNLPVIMDDDPPVGNSLKRNLSVASFQSIQERLSFSHHELREIIQDAESCWQRDSNGSITLRVDKVMSEAHLRESKVTTLFHARPVSDGFSSLSARSSPALTRSQSESQFQSLSGRRKAKNKNITRSGSSSTKKSPSDRLTIPPRRVFSFHAQMNHGYESHGDSMHSNGGSTRSMTLRELNNGNSFHQNGFSSDHGRESVDEHRTSPDSYRVNRGFSSDEDGKENIELTEIHLGGSANSNYSSPPSVLVTKPDAIYSSDESRPTSPDDAPSSAVSQSSIIEKMNKRLSKTKDIMKKKHDMNGLNKNMKNDSTKKANKKNSDSKKNKNNILINKKSSLLERRNGSASSLKIDSRKGDHSNSNGKVNFYINSPSLSPSTPPHTELSSPTNFTFSEYAYRRHSIKTNAIEEEDLERVSKADSDGFVDVEEENEDIQEQLDGYHILQKPSSPENEDTISIY